MACCFGVREYWSVGKSQSPNFNLNKSLSSLHYSTTPLLQQTHASRKDPKNPLWWQLKARSFGPGFFTFNSIKLFFFGIPAFYGLLSRRARYFRKHSRTGAMICPFSESRGSEALEHCRISNSKHQI
jgi:hypothetical protein